MKKQSVAQGTFILVIAGLITKILGMVNIMMFHAGIGIAMGLITFSATMIAIETLLFSDKEYKILYSFTKNNRFVNKFFIKRGKKLVVSLDKEVG